jgi:phage tail protein X
MAGTEQVYYTKMGELLDEICHKHYGATAGFVEEVLLANPGLADAGVVLPVGLMIYLPTLPAPRVQSTVKLWD